MMTVTDAGPRLNLSPRIKQALRDINASRENLGTIGEGCAQSFRRTSLKPVFTDFTINNYALSGYIPMYGTTQALFDVLQEERGRAYIIQKGAKLSRFGLAIHMGSGMMSAWMGETANNRSTSITSGRIMDMRPVASEAAGYINLLLSVDPAKIIPSSAAHCQAASSEGLCRGLPFSANQRMSLIELAEELGRFAGTEK